MNRPQFTRRGAVVFGARLGAATALAPLLRGRSASSAGRRDFDVRDFGAVGDGVALETAALQRAIDAASAAPGGGRVVLRGGRKYLIGGLQLRSRVDFHLADDAELVVSTQRAHFPGGTAVLTARDVEDLSITGTGTINGRSPEFMLRYDERDEWWRPGPFLPRLCQLVGCRGLEVRDVTFQHAPSWTLHLLGCVGTLVDGVKIRNQLDVPNCDGIDPDHCRDLEIRNCDIACGDDGIVIKTTRQGAAYGPSSNITVKDCRIETQDSGLKIGTETTQDIHDIRFERCTIRSCCRGLCIQLRDEGNISNIDFRDITFASRYFSDPWWGRGEAISLTALPRQPNARLGTLSQVRIRNVTARAENSVRINGSAQSRIRDVQLENVAVTLERRTKYRGGVWDNRPTAAGPAIEPHGNPAFSVRHADRVTLANCRAAWAPNPPDYFTHALEAEDVSALALPGFVGAAAHPERDAGVVIR